MVTEIGAISTAATNPAEIQALIVSRDQQLMAMFSEALWRMGIGVQRYTDEVSAKARCGLARFEAAVLDFDTVSAAESVVLCLRESPSSKNALIFAVATGDAARQCALHKGVNFAFERPLQQQRLKAVLRTAYGLMLRERRRYFRYPITALAQLKRASGMELECKTLNISRNGTALLVPAALDVGEAVEIRFIVPEIEQPISARGLVIWDDKHGKSGLSFECSTLQDQNRLSAWLDAHFYQQFTRPA
jgi:c-di-GMP-binding flagellar brake protein YcgR